MAMVERSTTFAKHIYIMHLLADGKHRMGTGLLEGEHTHRDADNANDDLNNGNSNHCVLDATLDEPVVGIESKDETEDVFEDNHQGKAFNGEISYSECKCKRSG
jgi:hypothetical protein